MAEITPDMDVAKYRDTLDNVVYAEWPTLCNRIPLDPKDISNPYPTGHRPRAGNNILITDTLREGVILKRTLKLTAENRLMSLPTSKNHYLNLKLKP